MDDASAVASHQSSSSESHSAASAPPDELLDTAVSGDSPPFARAEAFLSLVDAFLDGSAAVGVLRLSLVLRALRSADTYVHFVLVSDLQPPGIKARAVAPAEKLLRLLGVLIAAVKANRKDAAGPLQAMQALVELLVALPVTPRTARAFPEKLELTLELLQPTMQAVVRDAVKFLRDKGEGAEEDAIVSPSFVEIKNML